MAEQDRINREFTNIIERIGYVPSVARTLTSALWAATGQHRPDDDAVAYVLRKLWVDPKKGSVT